MPKPKRKKNFLGFGKGGLFSSSTHYPVAGHYGTYKRKSGGRSRSSSSESSSHDNLLDDIAKGMGGKSYGRLSESGKATVRKLAAKMNPRRKRNLEVGIPKNQFVNAKVRMKGGKIQVMADERVLGKAGFKAGAGLSGVSVSGGAKLNPRRRKRER